MKNASVRTAGTDGLSRENPAVVGPMAYGLQLEKQETNHFRYQVYNASLSANVSQSIQTFSIRRGSVI